MTAEEIINIYNSVKDNYDPKAKFFGISNEGYVIEAEYFASKPLQEVKDKGYKITYVEVHAKDFDEDQEPKVGLHMTEE